MAIDYFTILYANGRMASVPLPNPGSKWREHNFFKLLQDVYDEHRSAGSNWSRPTTLFINGVPVKMNKALCDVAWDYCTTLTSTISIITEAHQLKYYPAEAMKDIPDGE